VAAGKLKPSEVAFELVAGGVGGSGRVVGCHAINQFDNQALTADISAINSGLQTATGVSVCEHHAAAFVMPVTTSGARARCTTATHTEFGVSHS
jgi:hypothetical protein